MKKIGEYTVKGRLPKETTERITLFDGKFNTGYRVVKFEIAAQDVATAADAYAKLTTSENIQGDGDNWYWDDNVEIAWARWVMAGLGTNGTVDAFIDPDNMIIEDLYIASGTADPSPADVNYMITLEKYDITDWQGALAMVRNKSQG